MPTTRSIFEADFQNIDWSKGIIMVTACSIFVVGVQEIIPDWMFHKVNVVLNAILLVIAFLMKARKPQARTRKEDPPVATTGDEGPPVAGDPT